MKFTRASWWQAVARLDLDEIVDNPKYSRPEIENPKHKASIDKVIQELRTSRNISAFKWQLHDTIGPLT